MNEIAKWLSNPTYSEGVRLYKKYDTLKNFSTYFMEVVNCEITDFHFKLLIQQLTRLNRILGNNIELASLKPIESIPVQIDKTPGELKRSKELTNKLLSMGWDNLEYRDRLYFNNDEVLYLEKRKMLLIISSIDNEIKNLHAKLKTDMPDFEREQIAKELLTKDNERFELFHTIDNFEGVNKVKLMKELNNLRSNISKEKTKIENEKKADKKKDREAKLKIMIDRLKEIETIINE